MVLQFSCALYLVSSKQRNKTSFKQFLSRLTTPVHVLQIEYWHEHCHLTSSFIIAFAATYIAKALQCVLNQLGV